MISKKGKFTIVALVLLTIPFIYSLADSISGLLLPTRTFETNGGIHLFLNPTPRMVLSGDVKLDFPLSNFDTVSMTALSSIDSVVVWQGNGLFDLHSSIDGFVYVNNKIGDPEEFGINLRTGVGVTGTFLDQEDNNKTSITMTPSADLDFTWDLDGVTLKLLSTIESHIDVISPEITSTYIDAKATLFFLNGGELGITADSTLNGTSDRYSTSGAHILVPIGENLRGGLYVGNFKNDTQVGKQENGFDFLVALNSNLSAIQGKMVLEDGSILFADYQYDWFYGTNRTYSGHRGKVSFELGQDLILGDTSEEGKSILIPAGISVSLEAEKGNHTFIDDRDSTSSTMLSAEVSVPLTESSDLRVGVSFTEEGLDKIIIKYNSTGSF